MSQMCLSCSVHPATTTNGTVPLCAQCASLARGKERGVKMKPTEERPKKDDVPPAV